VPVDERVAVFDMDGTLLSEQPVVAAIALIAAVKQAVAEHPERSGSRLLGDGDSCIFQSIGILAYAPQ